MWSWRRLVRVDSVTVRLPVPQVLLLCVRSAPMVNVATLRMGSACVYLHTALALEMAIKTLDLRPAAASTSRAQQRTIEQSVDVSVPPEVAKIIRVVLALAVTQRDHTRTPAPDATHAAPAPLIEHVTYATPARVENVPQFFSKKW